MRERNALPALLTGVLALVGCSSAVPTETPGVERLGQSVLRYTGPEIEAVIGYRFAAANLGMEWLILDCAVTGASGTPVEIKRDRVFVLTPRGETVRLATQEEFGGEYRTLQPVLVRESIAADPLDYWVGRPEFDARFFTAPGQGVTFDSVTVENRRVASTKLFFFMPAGVQAGTYVLGIDLEESRVRIPFKL